MTSSTLFCESCGRLLFPGAALRVIERRTGRWSVVCRPFVQPMCFRETPSVLVARVELFDPVAADELDRDRERSRTAA